MTTATPTRDATKTFRDLGVDADLVDALTEVGITTPFPIQEITLPLALSGADVIGQARTGTGKTLAFGLTLLQRLQPDKRRFRRKANPVQALVIVPTRELCLQVRDDLAQAAGPRGIEVAAVYGGRSIEPQIEALEAGAPVVVGTPGRLLDLTGRGALDLGGVRTLVLDEADEMLDLGFLPDVERLIEQTPDERQTLLFSATMPAPVVGLARRYMRKPTFLRADVEEVRIAPETRQHFFSCHRLDKPSVLARILQAPSRGLCVVFVRTKRMADILANELRDRGIAAAPIHSDLRQEARERALSRFRQGKIDVLVATEVAARGLDIDDVTHVVNYDCPDDEKMYLHRIGRTGRAGAAGVAVTLAVWNELARLEMIKRALDIDEETHEVFSTSEVLDELFDLPPREGERRGPTKADWDRAVQRGRRETGKGDGDARGRREPRGAQGRDTTQDRGKQARTDRDTSDRGSPTRDKREAVASTAEPPGERTRTRVRRRSRSGASASGAGTARAGSRAAGEAQERAQRETGRDRDADSAERGAARNADDDGGAEGTGQRRTRRRTRTTSRGADGGTEPAQGRRDERSEAGPPDAGRAQQASSRRDDGRSGGRRGGQRGRSGHKGRQSSGRGGSNRGSNRGGDSRGGAAKRPAPVDSEAARGDGQPRLRRPLEVSYLP